MDARTRETPSDILQQGLRCAAAEGTNNSVYLTETISRISRSAVLQSGAGVALATLLALVVECPCAKAARSGPMTAASPAGARDMDGRLVQLSKAMSWLLRHGAADAGVNMDPEGYVLWDEMCGLKQFKGFSVEDVLLVVEHNSKKRFETMGGAGAGLRIRASQGHSKKVADQINQHKLLTRLAPEQAPAVCIHGTYSSVWPQIQAEGLKTMGRQHIHLTDTLSKQEGQQAVSGFRSNCDILIYVDVARAMADGLVFYRSANGIHVCVCVCVCVCARARARACHGSRARLQIHYGRHAHTCRCHIDGGPRRGATAVFLRQSDRSARRTPAARTDADACCRTRRCRVSSRSRK